MVQNAGDHIIGHAHRLAVAGGELGALGDDPAEERIVEAGRRRVQPFEVRRAKDRPDEGTHRRGLVEIAAEPGRFDIRLFGRHGLAGEDDGARLVHDQSFDLTAERGQFGRDAVESGLVDQQSGHGQTPAGWLRSF